MVFLLGNHLQSSWCHSRDNEQKRGSCWGGAVLWGLPWVQIDAPSHCGKKPDQVELKRLLQHSSFWVGIFMAQRLVGIVSLKNDRKKKKARFRFCHVCCMYEQEGTLISEISLFSSLRWDLWALRTVVCYTGWKAQSFLKKRSMPLCDQMAGIFYCISSIKLSICSLGLNSICWLPCFMQFGQESHLYHIWLL